LVGKRSMIGLWNLFFALAEVGITDEQHELLTTAEQKDNRIKELELELEMAHKGVEQEKFMNSDISEISG